MIAVLADDLTGAAEIAGIGWRHGLRSVILKRGEPPVKADLLVYDTDSRHCVPTEAARRVAAIARRLEKQSPQWIYKKVDSVLRGNVLAETQALAKVLRVSRCLLVPANPSGQRTIKHGRYFVGGIPLDRTDFRNDPTHPRLTSKVDQLLGASGSTRISTRQPNTPDLPTGITVGDAPCSEDILHWAARLDSTTVAAGGGEFFGALVAREHALMAGRQRRIASAGIDSTLFVSGSLAASSIRFVQLREQRGWPVYAFPDKLLKARSVTSHACRDWVRQISCGLSQHRNVIMTVGRGVMSGRSTGRRIELALAKTAAQVMLRTKVDRVCVEGGSTAAALLQELQWKRLDVQGEFARGVTSVRVSGLPGIQIVLKPGSYAWPRLLLT
jgi:uncharacterized protein YgbK (DUF1537 family)